MDSVHLNLNYSRSWFQTPNAYDNLNVSNVVSGGAGPNPVFANIGNTDQKSKIETFDIAPTYTRIFGTNSVLNFGAYVRRECIQLLSQAAIRWPTSDHQTCRTSSISQYRTLTNAGCAQISPTKRASTTSRQERSTSKHFCARMTRSASSMRPTTPHAWIVTESPTGLHRSHPMRRVWLRSKDPAAPAGTFRSLRSDARRQSLQLFRPHRCKRAGPVCRGPDQGRELALQSGDARRFVQRSHRCPPGGATRRYRVQYQAYQHSAARLLCANLGNAVQRESRAVQPGLLE